MSDALVETIIASALGKNEIKDAIREGRSFEGKNCAEGVNLLLWRCPICGKTDGVGGFGDEIRCSHCGSRWSLDANCRVKPLNTPYSLHRASISDLKDWHDWQAATLGSLARNHQGSSPAIVSDGVVLSIRQGSGSRKIGRGRLFLDGLGREARLVFEGEGERAVFDASSIRGFVDNFNVFSEFDHRGRRWRIDFGGGNALKWAVALSGASSSEPEEAA